MARDTLRLNIDIGPTFGKCFYFYPYPGTRLHRVCREYGLMVDGFESVSGYLEAPCVDEVFMSHGEMKKQFELLNLFFYFRLLFSKIHLPVVLEGVLYRALFGLRKPILAILDPMRAGTGFVKFRSTLRRLAMHYLR